MVENYDEVNEIIRLDDRIDIFRRLTVDEATSEVNHEIFSGLLEEYYDEFVRFCDEVESHRNHVKSVSCHIADKQIYFNVECTEDAETFQEDHQK